MSDSIIKMMKIQRCVGELVTAQAAANTQALAVAHGSAVLTYGELEASANQVAHHLLSLGLEPEAAVGLCLGHSLNFVIAALGILKAGGAYLPLDPTYPLERLTVMLKDAGAPFLVTDSRQQPCLANGPWKTVTLDGDAQVFAGGSTSAPAVPIKPSNLAYLIYTSGSTGCPKAVEISHVSLLNLVFWHQRVFGVSARDRAPFMAAVGFDAAVWELWPYLAAGASLHLPSDKAIYTVPKSLRDWKLPFQLVNNYGPTECTVVATSGFVESANRPGILPSIGKPIDNTHIYILDENLEQVPVGTLGELYIGGAGVAHGYRNRPDLTAEKFVPDPFSTNPEARLYRTGDFGSYLEDGQIAFAGRADDQLKIRGHRVETNEIIAVLGRHPAVQSNMVVPREDKTGSKYLVAYVVTNPEYELTPKALREFLRTFLPEYMVPVIFVRLEKLPLSPHGKVDRQALPIPDAENTLRDEVFTSPRTALEAQVGAIIGGLLGTKDLGVNDNFFLLGGNSFLGIQIIARVREKFGVEVPLHTLFEAPTIADLSAEVAQLRAGSVEANERNAAH